MLMFHLGLDIPRVHSPAFLMQALNMGANIAKCLAAWHTLVKAEIVKASAAKQF